MRYSGRWRRAVAWCSLGLILSGGPILRAQDVSVGTPTAWEGDAPVDEMVALKRKIRPGFPKEMGQTDEIGYAIATNYVNAKGKSRGFQWVEANFHPYEEALAREIGEMGFKPARRAGQAVGAWFWLPVIFNPRTASVKSSDATARLLALTPIIGPEVDEDALTLADKVRITFTVSETGAIGSVQTDVNLPTALRQPVMDALPLWKFAPARQAGRPVASQVSMTVLVQKPRDDKAARADPPVAISQSAPIYPAAMSNSGLLGEVLLRFTINEKGDVKNPIVTRSNNPGFNQAGLDAVLHWKFKPAMLDGKPVSIRVSQLLAFELQGGGSTAFRFDKNSTKGAASPSSGALAPDVLPVSLSTAWPVYPYTLLKAGKEGSAKIKIIVGERGETVLVLVDEASSPEFGLALKAAGEIFTFKPALKTGKPIPTSVGLPHEFTLKGLKSLVSAEDHALLTLEQEHPDMILKATVLDEPLKPLSRIAPHYPPELSSQNKTGDAIVEFLISQDGHARLPRIIEAADPAFGYAAVQAVAAWVFAPPMAGGKPVVVRVRIALDFKLNQPETSDKTP